MHEAISEIDGRATCPQLHRLISAYTVVGAAASLQLVLMLATLIKISR